MSDNYETTVVFLMVVIQMLSGRRFSSVLVTNIAKPGTETLRLWFLLSPIPFFISMSRWYQDSCLVCFASIVTMIMSCEVFGHRHSFQLAYFGFDSCIYYNFGSIAPSLTWTSKKHGKYLAAPIEHSLSTFLYYNVGIATHDTCRLWSSPVYKTANPTK
jgi:hypothetical protein